MTKIKKLYLRSWEYNMARVLEELAHQVVARGGSIVTTKGKQGNSAMIDYSTVQTYIYEIENRGMYEKIRDIKNKISQLETGVEYNEARENYLAKLRDQLRGLKEDDVIRTHFLHSIHFVLDGKAYYFEYDTNPFFPIHYSKVKVMETATELKTVGMFCLDEISDEDRERFMFDDLFGGNLPNERVQETAQELLTILEGKHCSTPYREYKRQRVPNTYDSRYHYENIDVTPKRVTYYTPISLKED